MNRNLAKEKTTLLERSIELSNKTFADFEKNIIRLGNEISELRAKQIDDMREGNRLRDIAGVATLIMMDHNKLSTQIKNALDGIMNGGIAELIPIHELEKDLIRIILEKNQALPTQIKGNGIYGIKNFVTTKATLYSEKIFLEIGIPVVERIYYSLYKAIPTPVKIENQFFILTPTSKYFLLNSIDTTYNLHSDV